MTTVLIVSGVVLPWLLVGLGGWLILQLIAQNGRIVLRLEGLEERLGGSPAALPAAGSGPSASSPAPEGLPVGSEAPAFELPDLDGRRHALADYRGRRVLLVFFGPRCGYCTAMIPNLAELARAQGPRPLVISSGSAEENRPLFRPHSYKAPVLLQQGLEVADRYRAYGTPIGYLIDEQGRIASPMAVGADALLALAATPALAPAGPSPATNGHVAAKPMRGNRPLETSKLVRDGLKAGTTAPAFRLPRVDGGELILESYRGRRVLLVFSDPHCGPCDALAPELERRHRAGEGDAAIVMISRRDLESNRKKVAELGLSFPVAMQKNWDVSILYGMFATPIGYLIDERGVLAADVAVGADAILSLLGGVAPAAGRDGGCLAGAAV